MKNKITSIEQLVEILNPDYKDSEQYTKTMNLAKISLTNIQKYCHWREDFYTRNLVKKTKAYELMVLCWAANQKSPIHNHQGQDCWMHVISGKMTEVQYHCRKDEGLWGVKKGEERLCRAGSTVYINDDICLHRIENNTNTHAVTLHLYSYPIETCNIYCCQTGKVTSRKLDYYSIKSK